MFNNEVFIMIVIYLRLSSDEEVAIVMVRKWTDLEKSFSFAMQRFYDAQNVYISVPGSSYSSVLDIIYYHKEPHVRPSHMSTW